MELQREQNRIKQNRAGGGPTSAAGYQRDPYAPKRWNENGSSSAAAAAGASAPVTGTAGSGGRVVVAKPMRAPSKTGMCNKFLFVRSANRVWHVGRGKRAIDSIRQCRFEDVFWQERNHFCVRRDLCGVTSSQTFFGFCNRSLFLLYVACDAM